jgi:hypothetical protein
MGLRPRFCLTAAPRPAAQTKHMQAYPLQAQHELAAARHKARLPVTVARTALSTHGLLLQSQLLSVTHLSHFALLSLRPHIHLPSAPVRISTVQDQGQPALAGLACPILCCSFSFLRLPACCTESGCDAQGPVTTWPSAC